MANENVKKDYIYRLKELADAMSMSIDNATKVIAEQISLMNIIKDAKKEDECKDFLASTEDVKTKFENQKKVLAERLTKLEYVIKEMEANQELVEPISILLEAIGAYSEPEQEEKKN